MFVVKDKCKFTVKQHTKLSSNTGVRYQINLYFEGITYSYTHIGFIFISIDNDIICPVSFYTKEAERFIESLGEKIEIVEKQ